MSQDQEAGQAYEPHGTEDKGYEELSSEAKAFLHLQAIHQGPAGLTARAWELADQYTECPVSRSGDEFLAWMSGPQGGRYIEALHQAAHDCGEQDHPADQL